MRKRKRVILKKGEYLSSKFDKLPCGIINKNETGIGATTLEISAERNSIIVEPLKVTASSKAKLSTNPLLDILYVGSSTANHPKKVSKSDIEKFILSKSSKFKKIIVVTDSLHKVIEIIRRHKIEDYFLTIDESDTMQTDAIYRESMEKCYEIYKEFPKHQRCMLTATQIAFNDPDLEGECITDITCDEPASRNILISYTENILGTVLEKVHELHSKFPAEKIVVAYNSVVKLKDLAIDIEKRLALGLKDVCILCGASSKKTADRYYRELESTKLPAIVNLKTSAYHTGFDLDERYHLITVVDNTDVINCISEARLKQIAGRCRDTRGLLSETIVYNFQPLTKKVVEASLSDLVEAANVEIRGLKCITDNFGKSSILKEQILNVRSLVTDEVKYLGYPLLKTNSKGEPQISYLNIDAALETQRLYSELYVKKTGLAEKLRKLGNLVDENTVYTSTIVRPKTDYTLLKKERIERIEKNLTESTDEEIQNLMKSTSDKIERLSYEIYLSFSKYLDKTELVKKIIKLADSKKSTPLESLYNSARFAILEEKSNFKVAISSTFELGKKYNDEEIHKSMNFVLQKLGLAAYTVDKNTALRLFDLTVKSIRNTRDKPTTKKVQDYNPTGIKICRFSKENPDSRKIFSLIGF